MTHRLAALTVLAFFALLAVLAAAPAAAQPLTYYQDPQYEKMAKEDEHPMDDMVRLAEEGDVRAQFILGDLYSKGQGGLPLNERLARQWFETAARSGEGFAFIRLAAMEKRRKKPVDAYKWYVLAADALRGDEKRYATRARDDLAKTGKLTRDQMRDARDAAAAWKKGEIEPPKKETPKKEQKKTQPVAKAGPKPDKKTDKKEIKP